MWKVGSKETRKNCDNIKHNKKSVLKMASGKKQQGQRETLQNEKEMGSMVWASPVLLPEACLQHAESMLHYLGAKCLCTLLSCTPATTQAGLQ